MADAPGRLIHFASIYCIHRFLLSIVIGEEVRVGRGYKIATTKSLAIVSQSSDPSADHVRKAPQAQALPIWQHALGVSEER